MPERTSAGVAKGQALLHRLAQLRSRNRVTLSGRLDIDGVRRAMVAEHDRQPGHPFAADQSDLDFLAVALNGDDGCKARLGKIDRLDALVGPFEVLRTPRVTASRCGASKSKSLVERDKSNVLLLRDIGRSSLSRREHQISQPPTPAA